MFARFARRPSLTLVGAVALVIAVANPAAAPPGDLDPTFDADGRVTTDLPGDFNQAQAVALQADGKIVAAGIAGFASDADFGLARYNTDGSLDTTFDTDGLVTTDFAGGVAGFGDEAQALAIQADGKIVAAGFAVLPGSGADFALARYNTDGSLDTTFSGDGKVTTDFGSGDGAQGVAIQGDGKIVAAGAAGPDFALARYNTDGSLDATFDTDGLVTTDFFGGDGARAVAIQGDGKIVAAGLTNGSETVDFALARYNTDGYLDNTFGGGRVTIGFGGDDQAQAVAIQADGKIVAAGFTDVSGGDFALARFNTDGRLDGTFDTDGLVTTDVAGGDQAQAVAIQGNGKIVAAGYTAVSGTIDFALARYNTDGSLDATFSGDGRVTTDFAGGLDPAFGLAIQADGKIVAAGGADVLGNHDFALARYTVCRRTSRRTSIPFCP